MRLEIGYDGSPSADCAVDLVGSVPWTPDTAVRVVTVVPNAAAIRSAWVRMIAGDPAALEEDFAAAAARALEEPLRRLRGRGLLVEAVVLRGRPPQSLAELAQTWSADLVVIGSRGLGAVRSGLLGSVSAEVIDGSLCPVLVARTPVVRGILLATDGSAYALEAERFLATLPVAGQVPVTVISVAHVIRAWTAGIAPTMVHDVWRLQAEQEASARSRHAAIADAAASRLRALGIDAKPEVRSGDPAGEIMAMAEEADTDLIVLGSRGQTGLRRIVLGSVARKVLYAASMSMLIVRSADSEV